MFLTKKHIPRRTFLRGGAVTLALPFLDAMVPARTLLAQTAARPKSRFVGIFVPHGMAPGYWVPSSEASGFTFPMEVNPHVMFERMFGDGSTAEERARRRQEDRSILDSLTQGLARFRVAVGASDRRRLEEYVEDIREIERRLQIAAKASATSTTMETPSGIPESFDDHIKLQYDLMALAFRADMTRVATLLYARDLTSRVFPASGVDRGFHGLSHHGENPRSLLDLATVNRYH